MINTVMLSRMDIPAGVIQGGSLTERHLSDLEGVFADPAAYARAVSQGNPLVYTVSTVEPGRAAGDLHYALGKLFPGRVGREYFMTKGHYHAWREAAEVYLGLSGSGVMLLEEERGASRLVPFEPETILYVPGRTAHRTINTGTAPLVYLGIYPATAGHDYAAIAARNFRKVVIERNSAPAMLARAAPAS